MSLIGSSEDGKISRQTAMKYKTYLSSVFSAAIRLEAGVTHNPVRFVKLTVKEPPKAQFVLSDLQTRQIAESLDDPRHKMMWNMNLWMGNRIGETRALRWKCIDWETGWITVTESLFEGKSSRLKTKAGERGVLLNEAQLAELKEYKHKHYDDAELDGWVFPGKRNRPIDAGWFMTKVIKPAAKRLGFPEIHWHALRHWNNSAMLNSGIDPAIRMKRVGHATARTNLIYTHPVTRVVSYRTLNGTLDSMARNLWEPILWRPNQTLQNRSRVRYTLVVRNAKKRTPIDVFSRRE